MGCGGRFMELAPPSCGLQANGRLGKRVPSRTIAELTRLPWRRVVRNGVLIGLVSWLHLTLFVALMFMNPRPPRSDTAPEGGDPVVLHARLIRRQSVAHPPRPTAAGPRARARVTLRPAVYARTPPSLSEPLPTLPSVPEPVSAAPATVGTYQAADADAFGDPSIRRALIDAQSAARPALPGGTDSRLSKAMRVVPPPSLRDELKSIGDYMSCSQIEMARNRPGQLNVVQIAQAYTAHGCKK